MPETPPNFDFLNLPRELRDEIYDYTLCSFSHEQRLYDIEGCAHVYSVPKFIKRKFLGNLNLLLAYKQIHEEGYKCMLEKNIFVRRIQGIRSWRFYARPNVTYILSKLLHVVRLSHESETRRLFRPFTCESVSMV